MQNTYTAIIKRDGQWWIGWIEEVPGTNCQAASREELLETLRITLQEALAFNRQDALEAAGEGFQDALSQILEHRAEDETVVGC